MSSCSLKWAYQGSADDWQNGLINCFLLDKGSYVPCDCDSVSFVVLFSFYSHFNIFFSFSSHVLVIVKCILFACMCKISIFSLLKLYFYYIKCVQYLIYKKAHTVMWLQIQNEQFMHAFVWNVSIFNPYDRIPAMYS